MLTYVDTLIGFAGVMLLLSLLVTLLVQAVLAAVNLRGLSLLWGVTLLVERASPSLQGTLRAWERAWHVLVDPALSPHGRLATAIRPEELVRALNEAGAKKRLDLRGSALRWMRKTWAKSADAPAPAVEGGDAIVDAGAVREWFDSVMDRTSEQFAGRTRIVTVVIAAVLAFSLHIDALALLRQISANPELRARLAQTADATLKMADDVAARDAKGAALATEALRSLDPALKLPADIPGDLGPRTQGWGFIDAHVEGGPERAAIRRAFDARYDTLVQQRVAELTHAARTLRADVAATQLDIASPGTSFRQWFQLRWVAEHAGHLAGVLMTTLFLGLGAPFWYNLLRQMGNLRPLLAGKVDEDRKADKGAAGS